MTVEVLRGQKGDRTLRVRLPADALGSAAVPGSKLPVTLNADDKDVAGYVRLRREGQGFVAEGPLLVDVLPTAKRLATLADGGFQLHARLRVSGSHVVSLDLLTTALVGAAPAEVLSDAGFQSKGSTPIAAPAWDTRSRELADLAAGLEHYKVAVIRGDVSDEAEDAIRRSVNAANGGSGWWDGRR